MSPFYWSVTLKTICWKNHLLKSIIFHGQRITEEENNVVLPAPPYPFFKDLNVAVTCILHFLSMQMRKWMQFDLLFLFFLTIAVELFINGRWQLFESGNPVCFSATGPRSYFAFSLVAAASLMISIETEFWSQVFRFKYLDWFLCMDSIAMQPIYFSASSVCHQKTSLHIKHRERW